MNSRTEPALILSVDDDPDILKVISLYLKGDAYRVVTAERPEEALGMLDTLKPDLILVDVNMPEMDGYEFCIALQKKERASDSLIIFLTAAAHEENRARAFALGAVDYLVKPVTREQLLRVVETHLRTKRRWQDAEARRRVRSAVVDAAHPDFQKFKEFLLPRLNLNAAERLKFASVKPVHLYALPPELGINNREIAKAVAEFLRLPYASLVNYDDVLLGVIPKEFSVWNSVVPVRHETGQMAFLISNPFDWELLDILKRYAGIQHQAPMIITEPDNIRALLQSGEGEGEIPIREDRDAPPAESIIESGEKMSEADLEKRPVVYVSNNILYTAVADRASDIHIEPKENHTLVRFRIDGDLRDVYVLKKKTGVMLISRYKALGGLDISERMRPQDGSVEAVIDRRTFKLRLATSSTPNGESLVIRLLEPTTRPKDLRELGMTDNQVKTMIHFANRSHGLVLIVGPTGAGKTTTIYSLLSRIDCKSRSLMSVEDPVEYRIPFANQQQVNEKAGVTFEALLKSAVRQDPDILFLGEVRDNYSARMSLDFASTGHLTITTLHTSNATTAIFRLERLGIHRGAMADAMLGIVAQRLLRRLCEACKVVEPISPEEEEMLAPFADELPARVAHARGCPKCGNTGYYGREGVYEILDFDPVVADMTRNNASIAEIRDHVRRSGGYLISHHAVEKVKQLIFPPLDVYERVLLEDIKFATAVRQPAPEPPGRPSAAPGPPSPAGRSILLVEDDADNRALILRFLKQAGYDVATAADGIEALMQMARRDFGLILSDINMPNLDGFKLLEMKNQKGIEAPLIFLTGRADDEDELKGLELGASDYLRKPVKKEMLLARVRRILGP